MTKKKMAVVLSAMLVFGAGMSVCAADAQESEAAVSEAAGEEGGSLVIGGTEVPKEEIEDAVTEVMEAFGLAKEEETAA